MSEHKQLVIRSSSRSDATYRQMALANLMVLLRLILDFMIPVDIREICRVLRTKFPNDFTTEYLVNYLKSVPILENAKTYEYINPTRNVLSADLLTWTSPTNALCENLGSDNVKELLRNLDCFSRMPEVMRVLILHLFATPSSIKHLASIMYNKETDVVYIFVEKNPSLVCSDGYYESLLRNEYTLNTFPGARDNKQIHITYEVQILQNETAESSFMWYTGNVLLIGKIVNDI